jgi:hypothetical protein
MSMVIISGNSHAERASIGRHERICESRKGADSDTVQAYAKLVVEGVYLGAAS